MISRYTPIANAEEPVVFGWRYFRGGLEIFVPEKIADLWNRHAFGEHVGREASSR